jgi:hypothetical protein
MTLTSNFTEKRGIHYKEHEDQKKCTKEKICCAPSRAKNLLSLRVFRVLRGEKLLLFRAQAGAVHSRGRDVWAERGGNL